MATLCQCGCGASVPAGRRYVRGHNKRKPWMWTEEDRGHSTCCWIWVGGIRCEGYAGTHVDGVQVMAHRAVYEKLRAPIPRGLELDHLCRVRNCVNPDHLEPVTTRENILRSDAPAGINARKTHCIRGHEFSPENTHIRPTGHRACRACLKEYHAVYYRKHPEKWAKYARRLSEVRA